MFADINISLILLPHRAVLRHEALCDKDLIQAPVRHDECRVRVILRVEIHLPAFIRQTIKWYKRTIRLQSIAIILCANCQPTSTTPRNTIQDTPLAFRNNGITTFIGGIVNSRKSQSESLLLFGRGNSLAETGWLSCILTSCFSVDSAALIFETDICSGFRDTAICKKSLAYADSVAISELPSNPIFDSCWSIASCGLEV